jgi:Kef-type K+ transport system membrane component KefB/nucleotide-binding universal stress UspA family protein
MIADLRPFRLRLAPLAACLLCPAAALAATGKAGPSDALFLAQLVVLIVAGRLAGEVMQRIGQPAVMGQLLAGIALGPSLFGALWPDAQAALFPRSPEQKAMIDAVSQLGILMLLLLAGMETDLSLVRKVRRAAAAVSVGGIVLPFACGVLVGELLPEGMLPDPGQRLVTSLFLGTALSISSVKIVAMVVREMNFARRDLGLLIVASAIIDDSIGWIIIALTFGVAATGRVELGPLAWSILGAAMFIAVSLTLGRRVVTIAIRLTNDHFAGELPVVSTVIVIMGGMALATHAIGLHTVLGAFVAGVLIGESPILTRQIEHQIRGLTTGLFMPVFFGLSGLSTDLRVLADPRLLALGIGLVAIASLGKFAGAYLGGLLGGLSRRECLALGCGMNARGSTEVVVATIGLSMGALSETLFTMIVVMAVVTTMLMPPTLRWALRRLPLKPEEAERLAREEFESQGFVTRFERLLVVADESPQGRFAARLAGLIAGRRGLPVTTLLGGGSDRRAPVPEAAEADVRSGASESRDQTPESPRPVDVTTRSIEGEADAVVAVESERGYDMLLVGIDADRPAEGLFGEEVTRIVEAFDGALGLVAARGPHRRDPTRGPSAILVAVNGTPQSRRGLETALAVARAAGARVTAIYAPGPDTTRRPLRLMRRADLAVLRDAVELAERFGVPLSTRLVRRLLPAEAILSEARAGFDLVVLGVTRRSGEALAFGTVAEAVLPETDRSVLLVSTGEAPAMRRRAAADQKSLASLSAS